MKHPIEIDALVCAVKSRISVLDYDSVCEGWNSVKEAMIRAEWSLEDQYNWYVGYLLKVNNEHELQYFREQIKILRESIDLRNQTLRENAKMVKRHSKKIPKVGNGEFLEKGEDDFSPVAMVVKGGMDHAKSQYMHCWAKLVAREGGISVEDIDLLVAFMGGDSSKVLVRPIRWQMGLKYLNWLLEEWYGSGLWVETISKRKMFERASTCFCNSKGEPISADSLRVNRDIKGMAERLFGTEGCKISI